MLGAPAKLSDVPLDKPLALMIGTELTGLSRAAQEMADFTFSVDMLGFAQSFNLSVFSALCLSNFSARGRLRPDWLLDAEQRNELLLEWLKISVSNWRDLI